MNDVNIDTIRDAIKSLPEEEQEIILHSTEIFEGEEYTIRV